MGVDRSLLGKSSVIGATRFRVQTPSWRKLSVVWTLLVAIGVCQVAGAVARSFLEQNIDEMIELCYVPSQPASTSCRPKRRKESSDTEGDCLPIAASYARYSSDLQHATSIVDQQRRCREQAEKDGNRIATDLEFADEAVSGTKSDRDGLNALMAAARQGRFCVLYFESLSRLARESIITMPMLKDLVYNYGIRVISITEGIDSNLENWEMLATFLSVHHEQFIKNLSSAVLRGQEGNVLAGISVGDQCLGYRTEPIPGSESGRRGKNAKPRMKYAIDPVTSLWVDRIFRWFVEEKRPIQWIVRKLTEENAPKDHRSSKPGWHHAYVRGILSNTKYVGRWPWGKMQNVRNPMNGKITQKERDQRQQSKWVRDFPELRIIADELFYKAQDRLAEYQDMGRRKSNGQLSGSAPNSSPSSPRHLLSGIVRCGECGATFHVSGAGAKYLTCRNYGKGLCTCKTKLQRKRAERMIVDAIAARVLGNSEWKHSVFTEAISAFEELSSRLPSELESKQSALAAVEKRISRLLDQLEDSEGDSDPDVQQRLAQRQSERDRLKRELDCLQRQAHPLKAPPTFEWMETQFVSLHELLAKGGPAAALALRGLFKGGTITVHEVKQPEKSRHYLRGCFTLTSITVGEACGTSILPTISNRVDCARSENIDIDFRDQDEAERLSAQIKEMFDDGVPYEEIARRLKCGRGTVTEGLAIAFHALGQEPPDGRKCRKRLEQETRPKELAERAKELWDQGLLLAEIGRKLGCNHHMAKKAVAYWFASRGMPVEDGRSRRKRLLKKQSSRQANDSLEARNFPIVDAGS